MISRNYSIGFEQIGIDIDKVRGKKSRCPKCDERKHRPNDRPLFVALDTGRYKCHRCDFHGRVDSNEWIRKGKSQTKEESLQVTDFEKQAIAKHVEKVKVKPFCTKPLSDRAYDYLRSRQISKETAQMCKLAQKTGYNGDQIVFNYYDDGKIVNAKYRYIDEKRFTQHKNAPKRVMWMVDEIKNRGNVIICEGEMDVLSWYEVGECYAVSVSQGAPNAGNTVGSKLKCVENAVEYLMDKQEIYISVDNDANGRYLEQLLVNKLGKDRCKIISYPQECKDANDVLMKYGKDALLQCKKNAKGIPVEGVTRVDDIRSRLVDIKRRGVQKGLPLGIKCLKDHFSFYKGWWNLYTGIPNSGKSEYVLFLMLCMSIQHGWKWAVFSPEHFPSEDFYIDAIEKFTGDRVSYIQDNDFKLAMDFINDHFFYVYFDAEDGSTAINSAEHVLNAIRRLKIKHDIDGFLIDPFNQLTKGCDEPKNERTDQRLERVLGMIDRFCKVQELSGNIVAHPRTSYKDNSELDYKCPTAYQISGGAMWYNKAYTITAVHRPFNQSNKSDRSVTISVQKVKSHKRVGKPADVNMRFDKGWYVGEDECREDCALYGALDRYKRILDGKQAEIDYEVEYEEEPEDECMNHEYDKSYETDEAPW